MGTLLALDHLWRTVSDPIRRRRRLIVVDEAWTLAHQPAGARFLYRLAKSARKHRCGLSVVTQDAADLLASDLGRAVVANAATQILLGQAPQALEQLTDAFALTEGEGQRLLAAPVGEGLLAGPEGQRAWFAALASPAEHPLLTTNPAPGPGGGGAAMVSHPKQPPPRGPGGSGASWWERFLADPGAAWPSWPTRPELLGRAGGFGWPSWPSR